MKRKMINVSEDTYNKLYALLHEVNGKKTSFDSFLSHLADIEANSLNRISKDKLGGMYLDTAFENEFYEVPEGTAFEVFTREFLNIINDKPRVKEAEEYTISTVINGFNCEEAQNEKAFELLHEYYYALPESISKLFIKYLGLEKSYLSLKEAFVLHEAGKTTGKPTQTYLLYSQNLNLFKIGRSKNIKQRIKQINGSGVDAELLHIIDDDIELELHIKYAEKRKGGEWFSLDTDDIEYIKSL